MEYLMTYGWAILIIALVLGALYSLGIFSGTSFAAPSCVASSGFYCQSQTYHQGTGVVSFTFGQATGTPWGGGNVVLVPYGQSYPGFGGGSSCTVSWANAIKVAFTGLNSGGAMAVSIAMNSNQCANAIGSVCQFQVYANYTISGASYVTRAASLTVKAA
jgi:hypothetical protein